jgi:hypothetical protein
VREARGLGSFETGAALTHDRSPFIVAIVVRLGRGPSEERLRQALDAVQARHPLLRARIVSARGRKRFTVDGVPPIPLDFVPRPGEDAWQRAAEEALNRGLDASRGPLLRATYLRAGPTGAAAEIVLAFHHAIVDAASGQQLVHELLTACGAPEAPPPASADQLPAPTEAFVPAAYRGWRGVLPRAAYAGRQAAEEVRHRLRARAYTPPTRTATCRILPRELDVETTAGLVEEGHRRRITLNSALHAALALGLWRRRYAGRPMTLQALAFADLRPYLRPQVAATTLACHIGMMRYPMRLRAEAGFWQVARELQERLYVSARRGEKFLANLSTGPVMRMTLAGRSARMAHTALSYAGALRLRPHYGALSVRGLHAFVASIPVGPEWTALARLHRDRLQCDFLYLAEDMDRAEAEAIAAEALGELQAAGTYQARVAALR